MAGMGLAIISAHTIHLEEKNNLLSILDVSGMPEVRTWFILHIINKKLSTSAEIFKSFMEKEAPKYMQSIFS